MDIANYTIEFNFTGSWVDYTDKIILADGYKIRKSIGKDGKHEIQKLTFKIHNPLAISAMILTSDSDIPARMKRNGTIIFDGFIRPFTSTRIALKRMEAISLTILDKSIELEQYVFESKQWSNLTLIDSVTPENSLIHKLFLEAGVIASNIEVVSDRAEIIPYYKLNNGDYLNNRIEEALYEYGLNYRYKGNDVYEIIDLSTETLIADYTLDETDIIDSLNPTKSDNSQKGVIVEWSPSLYKSDAVVYEAEIEEGGEEIAIGGVFPEGGDDADYKQSYSITSIREDAEIRSISNQHLVVVPESLRATKHETYTPTSCSAYVESYASEAITIESFKILADVWYSGVKSQAIVPGTKPKKYTAKVIQEAGSAKKFAQILANFQTHGKLSYSFKSILEMEAGRVIHLTEDAVSNLDIYMRILSVEFDPKTSFYSYDCQGVSAVDYTISVQEIDYAENAQLRYVGQDGADAMILVLETSSNIIRVSRRGTVLSGDIKLTAKLVNIPTSTSLSWTAPSGISLEIISEEPLSRILNVSEVNSDDIEILISCTVDGVDYTNKVSISKTYESTEARYLGQYSTMQTTTPEGE